jgi:hypothetical protein
VPRLSCSGRLLWRSRASRGLRVQVKMRFLESYAKKHPGSEAALTSAATHVVAHDGRALPDTALTRSYISEHDDVRIVVGPPPERVGPPVLPPTPTAAATPSSDDGGSSSVDAGDATAQCRNFGCQKRFRPADNAESACRHHTGPPMFRDGASIARLPPCYREAACPRPDERAVYPTTVCGLLTLVVAQLEFSKWRRRLPPSTHVLPAIDPRHAFGAIAAAGKKAWSCCPDRGEYEWEDFLAVAGCTGEGRRSTRGRG